MEPTNFRGFGLQELKTDNRDFQLGNIIKLPKLSELPNEFIIEPITIKHQGNTDQCTAYTSTLMSEVQENIELNPAFSFAASKSLSGDPEVWGQNLRDAFQAHVKFGALPQREALTLIGKYNSEELRYFDKWRFVMDKAEPYAKKSFFFVTGPYDDFDNIKASLWYFRNEKRLIGIGVIWSWALTQEILEIPEENGFGHAVTVIGWEKRDGKDYLVIQNSYGKEAGENGRHYLSRKAVNTFVKRFGAGMFLDLPKNTAKYYNESRIKLSDNWVVVLIKKFFSFIKI